MGIQQRLLKQRYSEYNYRTPTKAELDEAAIVHTRFPAVSTSTKLSIRDILMNPSTKDRYFPTYITLIKDFYEEVSLVEQPRVEAELYNQQLIRKLAYYITYPQYFANSFDHYGITWVFNLLMSMRSYIMRQRIARGEMKPCWNKCNPKSYGYYKLPKPMGNHATKAIAYNLYELCYSDTMKYIKKIGM